MEFQRNEKGDLVVTIESSSESVELYDAVEQFTLDNPHGLTEGFVQLLEQLRTLNEEYAARDAEPALFYADDATPAVGSAPVKFENRLPPTPLEDPAGWMAENVEFQLGKEAGWRGDELVSEKSPNYMNGYEAGQATRREFNAKMGGDQP